MPPYDAVLVDGQNIARTELMMLQRSMEQVPTRRFYSGEEHRGWNWYGGMEYVEVTGYGREAVDRAIAMDAVMLHVKKGVKHLLLASHDMDYGATAIYLRSMFPELKVSIAASTQRVKTEYLDSLEKHGIGFHALFDLAKPAVASVLLSTWRGVKDKNPLAPVKLDQMHQAMVTEQNYSHPFNARTLTADLAEYGFSFVSPNPIRRDDRGRVVAAPHTAESHVLQPQEHSHGC